MLLSRRKGAAFRKAASHSCAENSASLAEETDFRSRRTKIKLEDLRRHVDLRASLVSTKEEKLAQGNGGGRTYRVMSFSRVLPETIFAEKLSTDNVAFRATLSESQHSNSSFDFSFIEGTQH